MIIRRPQKMDVEEFVDGSEGDIEAMLEDPHSFDFRPEEPDEIPFQPDDNWMREASVDTVNGNVKIRFNMQSVREKYVQVFWNDDFSLVESHGVYTVNGRSGTSTLYYLMTDDKTFLHDEGWERYFNPRPSKVSEKAPEIYKKVISGADYDAINWGYEEDCVPPPQKDALFQE